MITTEGAVSKLKGNRNSSWAREDRHLGPQRKQQTWSQGRGLLVLSCWLENNPQVRNDSWYNHCRLLLLASQGATGETWCPVEHLERSLLCRGGRGEKQLGAACPSGVKETPWGNCLKNRVSSPSEGPPPWLITHWCSWCFAGARSESAALAWARAGLQQAPVLASSALFLPYKENLRVFLLWTFATYKVFHLLIFIIKIQL